MRIDTPVMFVDATRDRVSVNGRLVGGDDGASVDESLAVWQYYKPRGALVSHADPLGRVCLLPALAKRLGRRHVISVGRLDVDSEGLLLLTNSGALSRHLELPASNYEREYYARLFGAVTPSVVDELARGLVLDDGERFAPIVRRRAVLVLLFSRRLNLLHTLCTDRYEIWLKERRGGESVVSRRRRRRPQSRSASRL